MDEVDFAPGANVAFQQSKIMKTYRSIKRRMQSRFIHNGKLDAKLFLVSSKKSEQDFLESYIETVKNAPDVLIVDEPQWVVKPEGTFSKKRFKVAVGDKKLKSRIVTATDNIDALQKQGYRIIDVPLELRRDFERDVDSSLMEFAGISATLTSKFIGYEQLQESYCSDKNPFETDVISIGTSDEMLIQDFFRPELVNPLVASKPIFVHIDGSLTGDRTGISGVAIMGIKEVMDYVDGEVVPVLELMYRHVFSVGIQCPSGAEISLEKNRKFIYYLKYTLGWNIAGISLDGFQSADSKQQFLQAGFNAKIVSLDRTPDGYLYLKASINEKRISMLEIETLENELIRLERNNMTGKVDHPPDGCLTADTMVRTSNGDKRIVDLIEGSDKVYSYDLNTKTLHEVDFMNLRKTRDAEEIYEITTEDGKSIRCTSNHLILTQRGYVRAEFLTESDSIIGTIETPFYSGERDGEYILDKIEKFKDVLVDLYVTQMYSLSDLSTVSGFSKTSLNAAFSNWGLKRSKPDAQRFALMKYTDKLVSVSSHEVEFKQYLESKSIECIMQLIIHGNRHPYDLYVPSINLIVEIDGVHWHTEETEEQDRYNTDYAISNGFNVCRITDKQCIEHGRFLYEEVLTNPLIWSTGHVSSEMRQRYIDSVNRVRRKSVRYGIESYRGHKLSDHPRYRSDIDLGEVHNFITSGKRTITDVKERFKCSPNAVKRILREIFNVPVTCAADMKRLLSEAAGGDP